METETYDSDTAPGNGDRAEKTAGAIACWLWLPSCQPRRLTPPVMQPADASLRQPG
jgi:hypothetical protein